MRWLLGLVNPLGAIADKLAAAYQAKQEAKTDDARIRAEVEIEQLQARQHVLVAEQANWLTRWIRPAIAFPVVVYLWKIVIWDKVLGWGVTDPLDERMWWVFITVVGAYFLTRPFDRR